MGIIRYDQKIVVDTAESLNDIMNSNNGVIAFAEDTHRHYMFSEGAWYQIPNWEEMESAMALKADIDDISEVGFTGEYADILNTPTIPTAQVNADWSSESGASRILNKPTIPAEQVNSDWTSSTGKSLILNKPTLSTVATSGAYADLSGKPTIPSAQVNADWNAASGVSQIINKPSLSTVATTGSYTDLTNRPANRSQSSATRTLNTVFQVSATRDANVNYSASILNTVSLTGNSSGAIILEIATNAAFTSGVQELGRLGNTNAGTLVIGLVLSDTVTAPLSGYVPAGYYVRLRTVNGTGSPTYSFISGQEVWL